VTPSPFAAAIAALIRAYRYVVSPWLGANCRFLPSCSEYGIEAIHQHGAGRGVWLALRRVVRCHPWGGEGVDPVPNRSPTGR
jgi:uncharacterized protein